MTKIMMLKPRMSEKAYALSTESKVYVFEVPDSSNKHTIATAINEQFKVEVTKINITNSKGKAMRTYMGGSHFEKGFRSNVKKAYVTLKAGDTISIYPAEEAEPAPKKAKESKK